MKNIRLYEEFEEGIDGFSDFTKGLFDLTSKFGIHINFGQEKRINLDIYDQIENILKEKGLKCKWEGTIGDLVLIVYHNNLSPEELWNFFPDSPEDIRTFYPTDRIDFWDKDRKVRDKNQEYTLYVGPENKLYKYELISLNRGSYQKF